MSNSKSKKKGFWRWAKILKIGIAIFYNEIIVILFPLKKCKSYISHLLTVYRDYSHVEILCSNKCYEQDRLIFQKWEPFPYLYLEYRYTQIFITLK